MHVKLMEMIQESLIFPDLTAKDKVGALKDMAKEMAKVHSELDENDLFSVIMEREKLSTTGIGSGIAIPHAKMAQCKEHLVAVGRSRAGIAFDAIDGKPVHLVFLILGPQGANETHLKALARISKFLHDTNFRDQLITSENAHGMYQAILEKDSQY